MVQTKEKYFNIKNIYEAICDIKERYNNLNGKYEINIKQIKNMMI